MKTKNIFKYIALLVAFAASIASCESAVSPPKEVNDGKYHALDTETPESKVHEDELFDEIHEIYADAFLKATRSGQIESNNHSYMEVWTRIFVTDPDSAKTFVLEFKKMVATGKKIGYATPGYKPYP